MPSITSPINSELVLRGVTAALVPSLVSSVVFERETPFRLKSLKSAPGVLTQRVSRSNGNGLLTFAYRIDLTETDYDAELAMSIKFALVGLALSYADFRVDGPGLQPPNTFVSSGMEGNTFKFSYGLSVARGSRFCFLSTNAREFSEGGGTLRLKTGLKHIELDVASPLGTVPQRWITVAPATTPETTQSTDAVSSDETTSSS